LAGTVSGDPVEEQYMGGPYCRIDYTRGEMAPGGLFGDNDA
jgi:uronate dehydrogenase